MPALTTAEPVLPLVDHAEKNAKVLLGQQPVLTKVGKSIEAELTEGDSKFWLHLDVDILDRDAFPATDYLMPDGMSIAELKSVIAPLAASPGLIGVDVTCFNPEKDPDRSCGTALASLMRNTLLG